MKFNKFLSVILFFLLVLTACSNEPEPINYGNDECVFCKMLITDNKYGAEMVTDKGKIYKFDSVECLINFGLLEHRLNKDDHNLLVSDFNNPGNFIDARTAVYVHNENFRSPMGLNVSAFIDQGAAVEFVDENGGEDILWNKVIDMVQEQN